MNQTEADRILDQAVVLARQTSWERLRLYEVAQALDMPLAELGKFFSVKDELVEAWYDRADNAMLQQAATDGFETLGVRGRLQVLIMAWLDFLAQHKTVSRDMLLYKLEPAHIHLQIQGLLRISRTVQWLREAVPLPATHMQRIAEEIGLTGIFVTTFVYWMFDSSEKQADTRRFLDRKLLRAERLAHLLFPSAPGRSTVVDISEVNDTGEAPRSAEPPPHPKTG